MSRCPPSTRLSMPFGAWPAPDREAWICATSPGTALLDAGLGAHWREATRTRYRWSYGAWLAFLAAQGRLDQDAAPEERVTSVNILAFIEDLRRRNLTSRTIASHVQAIHNTLWNIAPEQDWSWLRQLVNFLVRNATPAQTDQSRLHQIDEVYKAALKLMGRAEGMTPRRPLQENVWFRDGLMVAVAAATALRRRNLALLELSRHLIKRSDGWYLAIPSGEVKNGLPIEGSLPRSLTPYLDRYLDYHRPRLLQGRQTARLWVNQYGEPLSIHSMCARLLKVTTRIGYPMRPHDFRRSAATTIAAVRPDLARIIGHFLGHSGQHTSELYYNKAQMLVSARRHTQIVMALKYKLRHADSVAP